jgi:tetratricopeptide (TPR) repeat protein
VVFVADDLAAWLIGLVADAGRKKLTTLVLGTDQERALRSAAAAAVRLTAEELRPGDAGQAEHVALVISQVFSEPMPNAPLAGRPTVLEALHAGIAGRLAVLDDASLTGTGQSSVQVLGVPSAVVAAKLTGHMVRQIVTRGSSGGPLTPLASQLNNDLTHLQGQRIEGKIDRLDDKLVAVLARLDTTHAMTAVPTALAQLPAATAGFTGRDGELGVLAGLLDPAGTAGSAGPVVVSAVAGLAGVGKTTLAVEAGHAARKRGWFRAGVLFVDLHGYDETRVEPSQALHALLRALGVPAEHIPLGAEERAGLYRSALAQISEPVLVIADNASSEAQVRPLLPGIGPHKVLVTSRNTLAGLGARLVDVTVLGDKNAIALLDGALRAARPDDDRITGDTRAATALARACGGLPLALQITASLLKADTALSVDDLAGQLSDEKERLEAMRYDDGSGAGGQSVAAAFELSYNRLEYTAAWVFRLLPANPGPDVSTAAVAVLVDLPVGKAREVLGSLARAHLIETSPGTAVRWRMHDLVRLYAQQLSDAHAEADGREQARDRLLGYYLAFAWDHQAEKDMDALEAEITGLIGAAAWTHQHQRHQDVLRLARALNQFLHVRGRIDEARKLRPWAMEAATAQDSKTEELWAVQQLAMLDGRSGRPTEARAGFARALTLARELGDPSAERSALRELGLLSQKYGQFGKARSDYQRALALAERLGDLEALRTSVHDLAVLDGLSGRTAEALEGFERALHLARELGAQNPDASYALAVTLSDFGDFLRQNGYYERSRALLDEALQTSKRLNYVVRLGHCHKYLASLEKQQGNIAEAIAHYRAALRYFDRAQAPDADEVRADLHVLEADPEIVQAVQAFIDTASWEEAQDLLEREHDPLFSDAADQLLCALIDQVRQNAVPEVERRRATHLQARLRALREARELNTSAASAWFDQPSSPTG